MKITDKLSIVPIKVEHGTISTKTQGTNFYYVVDVSGSMSSELPKLRLHLKNQLSTLLKEEDRITIVWFSSDNQCGVLQENVQVCDITQLENLKKSIDRYLVPLGCTAFRKPLELVKDIIVRTNSSNPNCLIFLTDGYNNDCKWSDVKHNLEALYSHISSAAFVEYGYYADSEKLSELAETIGGEKISADSFSVYEPLMNKKLSTGLFSTKKTEVVLGFEPIIPIVFGITEDNNISVFRTDKINVPENISTIYAFSGYENDQNVDETILYAASYILADKVLVEQTEDILAKLGDINLFKFYSNAFGKQKLFEFKDKVIGALEDKTKRFVDGKSDNIEIDETAFCIIELINFLQESSSEFFPFSEYLKYNKISRSKEKTQELSVEHRHLLSEAKTAQELKSLYDIISKEYVNIEFKVKDKNKGYSLDNLVYNEDRANVSILFRVEGTVELPENKFGLTEIETFRFFTYNIIRDGLVNFDILPVSINSDVVIPEKLLPYLTVVGNTYNIDIKSMPVMNRSMFRSLSATDLLMDTFELQKLKTANKVFKLASEPKTNVGLIQKYGEECASWLSELGISDTSGFSPKTKQAESTDSYTSMELQVKLAGMSSIPKVEDVIKKITEAKKPLTVSESLMKPYIDELSTMNTMLESVKSSDSEAVSRVMKAKIDNLNKKKNEVMRNISINKFTSIINRKLFPEFTSFEDNTLEVIVDGIPVKGTFVYANKQINI